MSIWWSLHLRREAASVPLARRFLLGTMETAGVDPDISFDLSVALSEACANAVEHGGDRMVLGEPGDSGCGRPAADSGQYRVTAYLDGEKCRIEVSDSGPGFPARRALRPAAPTEQHPQHLPSPLPARDDEAESGRGLDLIQQLSDHVQFGNRPGHGAVVRFDKVLKWREGALLTV
ncbi:MULTISPECIES: ATP-binding protein [Streptomyces]|uniref:Histidine kinase/HSP90-like ATPase domain-containing protein n=1 Tax=Streptomyces griseus subsp. griseus (strain JCM 4626 / CBS 651.72 / NBRC 13350 / KCC S-0626 / ISP 5235) TaxID=455632 RepID=B1VP72_STRGG|nr:ATP-binding protein [Streptomyces griseus]MYR12707.1 ATP-binding protein [Streptomyces sp. SID724]MBW3706099.1 ATP-binding protein [Streptomyces griseus]NEB52416.1 ATP-binding protein [Streptomyces griseus]SEE79379.1 serine/threonine-protein kinase RsbW [Streptomyces griseus]SQA23266.1 ATP-binding region ATPase domain protein [Streptomyces griseus]